MNKSIIFLDFDGVLCDSVKEAYVLSRYAYAGIDVYKEIDTEKYSKFCEYRYLISNSWQYYYLMKILDDYEVFDSTKLITNFNKLMSKGKTRESVDFNQIFVNKRRELINTDFKFWNELEIPTSFLKQLKGLLKNTKRSDFAILSTKNKEAIIKKFNYWDIELEEDLIFGKSDLENITKGKFIDIFMKAHREYKSAILIDDNENNIRSCTGIENVEAYLTAWGYINNARNAKSEQEILKIIKEIL